jgi:putative phage-type endonuclease
MASSGANLRPMRLPISGLMTVPELVCPAADRDTWLAARRHGITATDIVTILGLSPYDSPYSLFWRKLGQVPETEETPRMALGKALEPYAVFLWEEETEITWTEAGALYRSSARPWQMATPDRWSPGGGILPSGVLEVKTWADADRHAWEDGPPARVRAQVLWQMDVMDVAAGHVGVLFLPSGEFRSYLIEHDDDCTTEPAISMDDCSACRDITFMRAEGDDFWHRIENNQPPDPDASMATLAAVRARFPKREGKRGTVDAGLWDGWCFYKGELREAEAKVREGEILIREQLGEADEIEVDGELVGRRVIVDAQVKAHTRHQDYIRRIKTGDDE